VNSRFRRRIILSTTVAGALAGLTATGLAARGWYRSAQLAERRSEGLRLFAEGDFAAALTPLAFAARDNDDTEVVLALAESRLQVPEANARHLSTAAAYFRSVLARDERSTRAMHGLIEAYAGLGHIAELRPLIARLLAIEPAAVRAHEIELEMLNLTGRFTEAAEKARVLQALEPGNGRWRAAELLCLERSGADAEGRLARVREWRADDRLADDASLRLLESDLLREAGFGEQSREALRGLAATGVGERRELEVLVAAIESGSFPHEERDALIGRAIEASRRALGGADATLGIEGERLVRAGRFAEFEERFGALQATSAEVFRLRHAALYLSGRIDEARAFAQANARDDDYGRAARAVTADAPAVERIAAIAGPRRACPTDPVLAVFLADVLLDAGEFDEAQAILVRAFEEGGQCHQPLGTRAVRASVALGRVRDAFRIAEELLVRYGPAGDPLVAVVAVEAWAGALRANYQPVTRGGVYGSNSTEALRRFWTALSGPQATAGPAELAPAVADALVARGDAEGAREVLSGAFVTDGELDLSAARVGQVLRSAELVDPALQSSLLAKFGGTRSDHELAIVIADRLIAQGDTDGALAVIDRAIDASQGAAPRALERFRRPLVDPNGIESWLAAELRDDPSFDTAVFVLARPEPWRAESDALVSRAIGLMKDALGDGSIRALVAEAAMNLTFHRDDRSRLAASIAALDAAALRSPDSASLLTSLASLFEQQVPPQYARSAALLARAVDAEPGNASIYPQLVQALQQIGDFDGAEQALEAYIAVAGEDLQSRRSVADFKVRQGQFAEAARIREQLVGRSNEVVDAVALARIRQRMGDVGGAESILLAMREKLAAGAHATSSERGDGTTTLLLEREIALVYARDGRIDDARDSLARARDRSARPERVDEIRANVELAYGDLDLAYQLASELARGGDAAPHEAGARQLLLARIHLRRGAQDEARAALARALEADPSNADAATVAAALLAGDASTRPLLEQTLRSVSGRRPDLAAAIAVLDASTTAEGRIRPDEAALLRAQALTGEFSDSPLSWRVAAQLHLAADRADDACRIAQRALSRLPNDPAIGRLATEVAMAAGRVDEAASAAVAWRKMASAEGIEVDVARATIELIQRRPERGFAMLEPIAQELLARSGDSGPARVLVACAVQAGRWSDLVPLVEATTGTRRGEVIGAWIESAQTLGVDDAMTALGAVAPLARKDELAHAACIAAWTGLCGEGVTDACMRATEALASFESTRVPVALLAADLAAARGERAEADRLYAAIHGLTNAGTAPAATGSASAQGPGALARDPQVLAQLRANPTTIVALANAARNRLEGGSDPAGALALAELASAALPEAPSIADTHVACLVAARRHAEAIARAAAITDPILASIALGEVELARGAHDAARRALARAEARLQTALPATRILTTRIATLRDTLGRLQIETAAGERTEP
jgi:tetratricopeptide (TPR) repeat protein